MPKNSNNKEDSLKNKVNRRDFIKAVGSGTAAAALGFCTRTKHSPPPNFIIIFTDDQGYQDVGCYGAQGFETPNLDRMADAGIRFTSFYAAQAVCSASRAALLTGCYPNRISLLGALMPQARHGIHPDEETLAELLHKNGYATAIFGKWHLGHLRPFLPLQHGFDEYFGLPYSNDMWPWDYNNEMSPPEHNKSQHPFLPLFDGNEVIAELTKPEDQDQLTTSCTKRAVSFINRNKDKPFFLYIPHSMPHTPLGVSDKFKGKSKQGKYGDVIMEIDWSTGQILQALKENGLEENTLVIFTSDNGPWLNFGNHAGSAGPLREGKGTSWEGGVRVPCIMRWPGVIPAGAVCDKMAATIDLLPTLTDFAGAPRPQKKIDGVNIAALLQGDKNAEPRNTLYYYYGKQLQCVRAGKWKLHFPHSYRSYEGVEPGQNGLNGPYARGETGLELYDLEKDMGETLDVAAQFPDIVNRLQSLGEKAREALGDKDRPGKEVRPHGRLPD